MTKHASERIAAGLNAAIDVAEGRTETEGFVVHDARVGIAALRERLGLSQAAFAACYGSDAAAIEAGENRGTSLTSSERAYLRVIDREPGAVARALSHKDAA